MKISDAFRRKEPALAAAIEARLALEPRLFARFPTVDAIAFDVLDRQEVNLFADVLPGPETWPVQRLGVRFTGSQMPRDMEFDGWPANRLARWAMPSAKTANAVVAQVFAYLDATVPSHRD